MSNAKNSIEAVYKSAVSKKFHKILQTQNRAELKIQIAFLR